MSPWSAISDSEKGFTLIELVMVIALLGIIGVMGAHFVSQSFLGFAATDTRLELYEEGKMVLARLEREFHNSLPNAVQLAASDDLRFGLIDERAMRSAGVFGQYSEATGLFPVSSLTDLEAASAPQPGWVVSVYNRRWADFGGGGRLFQVTGVTGSRMDFGAQSIQKSSPNRRYFVVDRAVRYHLDVPGQTLLRAAAPVSAAGVGAFGTSYPVARNVTTLTFDYAPGAQSRNGLLVVRFTLARAGETVSFHKEIHVRNAP